MIEQCLCKDVWHLAVTVELHVAYDVRYCWRIVWRSWELTTFYPCKCLENEWQNFCFLIRNQNAWVLGCWKYAKIILENHRCIAGGASYYGRSFPSSVSLFLGIKLGYRYYCNASGRRVTLGLEKPFFSSPKDLGLISNFAVGVTAHTGNDSLFVLCFPSVSFRDFLMFFYTDEPARSFVTDQPRAVSSLSGVRKNKPSYCTLGIR